MASEGAKATRRRSVTRRATTSLARSGMTGLVAAALIMVGGGLGAVAALAASPAGASTAHSSLPPVNVSVSNTPTVNIGNQPTVNVGNLPISSNGRLKVESGGYTSRHDQQGPWYQIWSNGGPQWITITNVGGSGVFKGFTYNVGDNCNCNWLDGYIQVITDGNQAFGAPLSWISWPQGSNGYGGNAGLNGASWYNAPGVLGGSLFPCCQYIQGYFFPPGGLPFTNSLQVLISPYWWGPQHLYNIWCSTYYTLKN